MNALGACEWGNARKFVDGVTENDFVDCPPLLHAAAMARLMTAVPDELRPAAFAQVPFEADKFPLASKPENLVERRAAQKLFERISEFAQEVGTATASNLASDYALWLGLRDPETHEAAMVGLRESMGDPAKWLRRLNLAIRFGLKVDYEAIEQRIDQSVALSGDGTADEAFARLSLAFTRKSHKEVAEYIEKHRKQLYQHLQKLSILGLEIEVLARAGLVATARERLQEAIRDGLSPRDQNLLETIISEMSGSDPIARRRALYDSTHELRDLVLLVDALEGAQLWHDLLPYAEKLFEINPSVETYERVVLCLNELGRYDELFASMSDNAGLIAQSHNLKSVWAWTLYREDRFAEATAALQQLSNTNDPNARTLRLNIAIASGAWDTLLDFCQDTWNAREQHSAAELLRAAQVSFAVDGPHSRDLVVAATEKDPDNPGILAAAYFQASSAGWEQTPLVASWLNRAAQLSGNDGPLKTLSMQELIEKKPEWDKQAEFAWDQLRKGGIPTFAAGQLLNRSLLDFYLLPALANASEVDVRKRQIIFAYSGVRLPLSISQPKTLALDIAAIITLSQLGLLEKVLTRYEIAVPHSTMGWLFQERQKATFHQPSRIKDATVIKQLIANGTLDVLRAASRDHKLVREVGPELAAMLSAAREKLGNGKKILVVRSSPLHRLGTLLGEEADITGYESCICSCGAVIDRLKIKGALTQSEEQKARDFLKLREHAWPNEPTIDDETEIYLDDLSVSYLLAANALGKLKAAGLRAYISQNQDREADSLIALESLGNQQLENIEGIRRVVAEGIATGRVKAARTVKGAEDERLFRLHPTYAALGLVAAADAIVVDDRYINQHPTMTSDGQTKPVLCSLDVLNLLYAARDLSADELFAHRTALRQAGYQLIPVAEDELLHHLKNAAVVGGKLIESAELRAIRESLLRARMSTIVQLPSEANFLFSTLNAYVRAIRASWEIHTDRAEAEARSEYLLAQVDARKWAPSAVQDNERAFALYAYASNVLQITAAPAKIDENQKAAYYEWVTDRVLGPVKEHQPEMYEWIITRSRELVVSGAEKAAHEYENGQ